MSKTGTVPEYGWQNAEATHAHGFLWPALERVLDQWRPCDNLDSLKVFDAGCGNGFIAGKLAKKGFHVIGCDTSEMGVSQARNSYPEARFEVASVYDNLSERFGSEWDLIISSEVVEHLYDPRLFARNLFTLLKPGGVLVLTTPYHGYLKNVALALSGKLDKHFTVLWDGGHIKFWSYETLSALLHETGFAVKGLYGAGRIPYLWKSMIVVALKN